MILGFLRSAAPARRSEALPPLDVGGRAVMVALRRDARARRLTLRADPVRGELRVTLPLRAKLAEAASLIAAHRPWIAAQVTRWPAATAFVPGATIPFDGGLLHLDWSPGRARGLVRAGDRLVIGGDAATLPGRVTRWLKAQALADLEPATRALAARVDRPVTQVRIGDPAARWGSCHAGSGRIAYSWRLILAPRAVRHGVVAHEVAHLVHPNHGAEFWRLAAELGGDPAPGRRWLRIHGAALHWVGRD